MVFNSDKCHLMVLGDPNYTCNLIYNGTTTECSEVEKTLKVLTIDDKLISAVHHRNII